MRQVSQPRDRLPARSVDEVGRRQLVNARGIRGEPLCSCHRRDTFAQSKTVNANPISSAVLPQQCGLTFLFILCLAWTMTALGEPEVRIDAPSDEGPVRYAVTQLEKALDARGYQVQHPTTASAITPDAVIELGIGGSNPAEGYRIARRNDDGTLRLEVHGGDARGVLHGALALCEALEQGRRLEDVQPSSASPRFPFRAIKFNLPWYGYRAGEALALHSETCRDLEFWEAFLDMMARNRFNTLTLWSQHPFHLMIRNTRFPEACPLTDIELAEWQTFWHRLFALARERGIDTYLVNWNIFVSPAFAAHHGVAAYSNEQLNHQYFGDGETAEIAKDYTRTTIAQVIDTYPDLTGLGVSLGERMGGMTAQQRQNWIMETVVAGMRDAKRPARLIHRAPFSADTGSGGSTSLSTEALTRRAIESIESPGPIWVEVKFNWSHAQSSPRLVHVHGGPLGDTYWNPAPKNYRIVWMARNEDFFCLRWSEPDFVRRHIELNGPSYVGGYFLGSECYIPAQDYLTRPELARPWRWAFERQWLYYATWGRLLYDPATPDTVFREACEGRYGPAGGNLYAALKLGSRMPLRLASFHKGTWDFTLYSEGFSSINAQSNPDRFLGIEDLIGHPVLDPDYVSIKDYVQGLRTGRVFPPAAVVPPRLADELEADGQQALDLLSSAGQSADPAWAFEMADARAWAYLSLYFAEKLRGTVAYHQVQTGADPSRRDAAVDHLTRALGWWDELVRVTKPVYAVMPLAHLHHQNRPFHWELLRPQVARDLELARQLP